MRWNWFFILCAGLILTGCDRSQADAPTPEARQPVHKPSDRIAQIHFIGSANVTADTNAALLAGIWDLPETQKLKDQTLNKLAMVPFELAKRRGITSTNDFVSLVRPLLDDLVRAESWVELRGETNQTPDFALAVQLGTTRAELWRTNLSTILTTWTGLAVVETNLDGLPGWELKKHDVPNLIRFQQAGGWVVLSAGEDKISLADELIRGIKSIGRPCPAVGDDILSLEGDLTRIAGLIPLPEDIAALKLDSINARWSVSADGVATHIVASRADAFDLNLEPWRIPTNLIHQPLAGFTAVQGVAGDGLAGRFPQFKLSPMPQQYFVWTMQGMPLQTYAATPVENASNALAQLTPQLLSMNTNPTTHMAGYIESEPKSGGVMWTGMPFILPFLEGVHEANGDFLFGGAFSNPPHGATLPEAMLNEVKNQTNLVYYAWEITAERLNSWRNLIQIYFLMANYRQLDGTSASARWLNAMNGNLGNALTEIHLTKQNELTLDRKSPIGLTAFELVMLADWLETPDFPFDKPIMPIQKIKRNLHRRVSATPPVSVAP